MGREVNEVKEEFANGLMDLTVNNKALINMFTMLAEDHIAFAEVIVDTIEDHLKNVPADHKLVVLYLIDSIVKNVGQVYKDLFSKDIVQSFCNVFERVDEKTRIQMYKLRHTWMDVFSTTKLYALDCKVHTLDPAWPIIPFHTKSSIHVNPKFLTNSNDTETSKKEDIIVPVPVPVINGPVEQTVEDRTWLMKQAKLLKLQQRKLELEIEKVHIEEQQKQLGNEALPKKGGNNSKSLIKPEAIRELEDSKANEETIHNSIKTTIANTINIFSNNQIVKTSPIDPRLSKGTKTALAYQHVKIQVQPFSEKQILIQTKEEKSEMKPDTVVNLSPRIVKEVDKSEVDNEENVSQLKQFVHHKNGLIKGHDFHIDVDLRRIISNKRASLESEAQENTIVKKKLKIESDYDNSISEDVNLNEMINEKNETAVSKQQLPPPPPPKISTYHQFDSLRAKLAIVEHVKKSPISDSNEMVCKPQQTKDISLTELISQSTDKLKKGLITATDMSNMVQEFMMRREKAKLEEAQEKDGDSDLQPISDDELVDFSNSDDSNEKADLKVGLTQNNSVSNDNTFQHKNGEFPKKRNNRRYFNHKRWQHMYSKNILMKNKNSNYNNNNSNNNNNVERVLSEVTNVNEIKPPPGSYRIQNPPTISAYSTRLLPPVNESLVSFIEKDTMRTIIIDGIPREIRFYGDTAVIFLNWDDPREISFYNGARCITFNKKDSYLLTFNESYREVLIDGHFHKVRVGAPTRELFIDNKWYESLFGGPEFLIELDDKMCSVILDGPPPQVKISDNRRTDLVIGKINLIVDAQKIIPIFLDAKPQKVEISDRVFTFRFANALKTVLINEIPFRVEFGGLPKPILIGNRKHFIRFSVLPIGVEPGSVRIANMEEWLTDTSDVPYANTICPKLNNNSLFDGNRYSDNFPHTNLDDILSSAVSSSMAPSINSCYNIGANPVNTQIPSLIHNTKPLSPNTNSPVHVSSINDENQPQKPKAQSQSQSFPNLDNININELFRKLVANGIIPQSQQNSYMNNVKIHKSKYEIDQESLPRHHWLKIVSFDNKNILKIRNGNFINSLYTGVPCSMCGIRFLPNNTKKYSEHLDWHFGKNRAQRELSKTPLNRQWYLSFTKWVENSLLDNLNMKEKNWIEVTHEKINNTNSEVPSVPSNTMYHIAQTCVICFDEFVEFYNQEEEEWHLRDALRIDNKLYHPFCYEDHIRSLNKNKSPIKDEAKNDTNELSFDTNTKVHDDNKLSHETSELLNDDTRKSSNDVNVDEKCINDVENVDDSVLIIKEIDPKQKSDSDRMIIDILDDDCVNNVDKSVESEPMLIDVREIKTEIDNDSENELKSEGFSNSDSEEQFEDEEDVVQKNMMSINYTFDGDEVPKISLNTPVVSKLKITVSESLLANSRQTNAKLSDISDDSSIDDIIIEREVQYQKPNSTVTIEPNKIKPMLHGVQLRKCPMVSKCKEETSICSLM